MHVALSSFLFFVPFPFRHRFVEDGGATRSRKRCGGAPARTRAIRGLCLASGRSLSPKDRSRQRRAHSQLKIQLLSENVQLLGHHISQLPH